MNWRNLFSLVICALLGLISFDRAHASCTAAFDRARHDCGQSTYQNALSRVSGSKGSLSRAKIVCDSKKNPLGGWMATCEQSLSKCRSACRNNQSGLKSCQKLGQKPELPLQQAKLELQSCDQRSSGVAVQDVYDPAAGADGLNKYPDNQYNTLGKDAAGNKKTGEALSKTDANYASRRVTYFREMGMANDLETELMAKIEQGDDLCSVYEQVQVLKGSFYPDERRMGDRLEAQMWPAVAQKGFSADEEGLRMFCTMVL